MGVCQEITWNEFKNRFVFNDRRQTILIGLSAILRLLGQTSCQRVFLGGSFIEIVRTG